MQTIRSIAVSVCVAMAATGILSMLMPGKSMEKTVKIAVGLFFLSSIILPLTTGDFSLELDWLLEDQQTIDNQLDQTVQQHMEALTTYNLEQTVRELLEKNEISVQKVEVSINIEQTSSITITRLDIVLPEQEQKKQREVSELVKQTFGIKPEVTVNR